jgi:hypothetical protein
MQTIRRYWLAWAIGAAFALLCAVYGFLIWSSSVD